MNLLLCSLKETPITNTFSHPIYLPKVSCNATELVHFWKRVGVEGINLIFSISVTLRGKQAQKDTLLIDTIVQEKSST